MIPLFKPWFDKKEEQAVANTLRSGWIGTGPQSEQLEQLFVKLTGKKYAVALNSATASLHLGLLTSIKPGDEVITASLTFVAANQCILLAGGVPVFADVDETTLCLDPQDVVAKITSKTKAIVVTHYGGHPVDLKPILKAIKGKKITLIEDCAHAMGSYYHGRHVGGWGDLGCFSFSAIKNVTTGDGGMLVTNDQSQAKLIRQMAWSGIDATSWKRFSNSKKTHKWEYDITSLGYKYQMNDIAASIGIVQFNKLKRGNALRKAITQRYRKAFAKHQAIKLLDIKPWTDPSYHNFVIKVDAKIRNNLIEYLNSQGISANVHYLPSHYYDFYKKYSAKVPVTEKVWRQIVMLPIFPDLTVNDQQKIIKAVLAFLS